MRITKKIVKIAYSLGIIIDKPVLDKLKLKKGDYVEWIPNLFGVRVDEWASWVESLNTGIIAYWNFNQSFP